jgi:hypothetical protein
MYRSGMKASVMMTWLACLRLAVYWIEQVHGEKAQRQPDHHRQGH